MRLAIFIFQALALGYVVLDFILMIQVECNRAVNLLLTQRRVVRSDRLRRLSVLVLPDQPRKRNTASRKVEASIPTLDEIPPHYRAARSSTESRSRRDVTRDEPRQPRSARIWAPLVPGGAGRTILRIG